jgi:hypothetical protein
MQVDNATLACYTLVTHPSHMDHDKSPSATAPPPRIRAVLFDMAGVLVPTLHSLWTGARTHIFPHTRTHRHRDTHAVVGQLNPRHTLVTP